MNRFEVKPIGIIRSLYETKEEAPRQGGEVISEIEIFDAFEDGLKDIDGFSHLHVFYWLHQSVQYSLSVKTPWDEPHHGLFATRSPNRPNPLGYSVVQLIRREKNVLKVKGLDAIEGTPVVDIKPYFPDIDARPKASRGWRK